MYLVWIYADDYHSDELLGVWPKRSSIPESIKSCSGVTIELAKPTKLRSGYPTSLYHDAIASDRKRAKVGK